MKTVSLNISERLYALAILNQAKGNLEFVSQAVEDVKQLPVTEEEWVKAEKKVTESENEKGEKVSNIRWDNVKGGEKEITFQDKVSDVIVQTIKQKDDKGELGINNEGATMMALYNKLK